MSSDFFGRKAWVQVGPPANDQKTVINGGRAWEELRIVFDVELTTSRGINTCDVEIWNLGDKSIELIKSKGAMIALYGGYGDNPPLLFRGSITRRGGVTVKRTRTDRIVTIKAGDGEHVHQEVLFNKAYDACSNQTVLSDLLKAFGMGTYGGRKLPEQYYPGGIAFSGLATRALDVLAQDAGVTWSMQRGMVQFLAEGETTKRTAVLLSKDSGLIGSPEFDDKGNLKLVSLLNPDIVPGRLLKVESMEVEGFFKAKKVVHKGDTHGKAWFSEIEAKRL